MFNVIVKAGPEQPGAQSRYDAPLATYAYASTVNPHYVGFANKENPLITEAIPYSLPFILYIVINRNLSITLTDWSLKIC